MKTRLHREEPVAQLVEHLTFNPVVAGSTPAGLTEKIHIGEAALPLSSSGLGHRPFTPVTGVQFPLGARLKQAQREN